MSDLQTWIERAPARIGRSLDACADEYGSAYLLAIAVASGNTAPYLTIHTEHDLERILSDTPEEMRGEELDAVTRWHPDESGTILEDNEAADCLAELDDLTDESDTWVAESTKALVSIFTSKEVQRARRALGNPIVAIITNDSGGADLEVTAQLNPGRDDDLYHQARQAFSQA